MTIQFGITFVIAIAVLFIILKVLSLPMKIIIKLVINGVIGGITIWIINLIGANFGFTIALNWITALIVGIFGIPGAVILAIIQLLI